MSNDKVEATFYDGGLSEMYDRLAKAIERDRRRKVRNVVIRDVGTTLCVTLWFTVCILSMGWLGYVPAVIATASYFVHRDLRALDKKN